MSVYFVVRQIVISKMAIRYIPLYSKTAILATGSGRYVVGLKAWPLCRHIFDRHNWEYHEHLRLAVYTASPNSVLKIASERNSYNANVDMPLSEQAGIILKTAVLPRCVFSKHFLYFDNNCQTPPRAMPTS
jgi:hypothetical protein